MRVLVVTYIFKPEPIVMSTIVGDLVDELSKSNDVTVLRSKPCRPYGYKFSNEIETTSRNYTEVLLESYICPESTIIGRTKENFSFAYAVKDYLHLYGKEFDVIYMNAFPLFAQKIILKEALKNSIPVVNHVEDIYPDGFRARIPVFGKILSKLLLPIDKWIARNSTTSVVIGEKIRESYSASRKVDINKIQVVYNWQDESRFKKETDSYIANKIFTFMYAGSISKAAGLHDVLYSFVESKITDAQLIFAGNGTERELLQKEASCFPQSKIKFIDAPAEKIAEIQSMADVLVLPLQKEISLRAFPSKFPAYLFSAKPVLACVEKQSDVADIIRSNRCGWIVSPENKIELSEMMKKITNVSQEELVEMGTRGYKFSQTSLTRDSNLKKLVDIVLMASKNK